MRSYRMTVFVNRLAMHPLTPLDGTIAGIAAQDLRDKMEASMKAEDSKPKLDMFREYEGVPLASYPLFTSQYTTDESVLRDFDRHLLHNIPVSMKIDNKKMSTITGSDSNSYHPGSTHRVHYPNREGVTYYFTGDENTIFDIMTRCGAIGAWTGKGYGNLIADHQGKTVHIHEMDFELCGILDEKGNLVRPVPIAMAKKLGIPKKDYSVHVSRSSIPYGPHDIRKYGYSTEDVAIPNDGFEKVATKTMALASE